MNNPGKYELDTLLFYITANKTKCYSAKLKKYLILLQKGLGFAGFKFKISEKDSMTIVHK